jgi:hypothetical protein
MVFGREVKRKKSAIGSFTPFGCAGRVAARTSESATSRKCELVGR